MSTYTPNVAPWATKCFGTINSYVRTYREKQQFGRHQNSIRRVLATATALTFFCVPFCYAAQSGSQVDANNSGSGLSPNNLTPHTENSATIEPSTKSRRILKIDRAGVSFANAVTSGADEIKPAPKLQGGVRTDAASGESNDSNFDGNSNQAHFAESLTPPANPNSPPGKWLSETHPEFNMQQAVRLADQIVVVSGDGEDKVDRTLKRYGIPFKIMTWRPRTMPPDLNGVKVLILTCDDNSQAGYKGTQFPTAVSGAIRQWVSDGGFLITTGWETKYVSKYIPGYFRSGRVIRLEMTLSQLAQFVFSAGVKNIYCSVDEEITNKNDSLWAGVDSPLVSKTARSLTCSGTWTIAESDPNKDKILMTSQFLAQKGKGQGVLAGVFTYGKGRVLHYTSHIHDVSLSSKLVEPQEIMAINFILEAVGTGKKM
jgi:hypothetical protein